MKSILWFAALVIAGAPAAHGQATPEGAASEGALKTAEEVWGNAIVKRDPAAMDRLLAEDYVLTTPEGRLASKAQVIQNLRSPADPSFLIKGVGLDKFKIRVFGDTAVVSSRFTLKVESEGRILETPFRHTDVFVKRHGEWQCVARHATRIRQSYGHEGAGDNGD